MKKFIVAALFLAALVALAGCNTAQKQKKTTEKSAEGTTEETKDITPVDLEASEYVKLGDYKDITVDVEKRKITDEDVEETIEDSLEAYAEPKEIKDRDTVEKGDYVNLDYTTYIDGKKNEDYSDTEVDVKAEDGEIDSFIGYGLGDDFKLEEKVIGSKVDDTVTVEFTYPKDYDDASVAGKKAKMEVVIRGIFDEEVPSVEEYVKKYEEGKTVDQYKAEIRAELEEQAQEDADSMAKQQIWKKIVDNATQTKDFTDAMLAQQKENVLAEIGEIAMYYDMNAEDFIKEMQGMTVEEYAAYSLKERCVEELLIEEEKIEVSDKDLDEEMKKVAEENGLESVDEVTDYYSKDEIRENLLEEKLFDKLMSYNKVNTKEVVVKDDDDSMEVED